jgi:subtilisin family serine protease
MGTHVALCLLTGAPASPFRFFSLVTYVAFSQNSTADFGDSVGHGTHVAGIALGACYAGPATAPAPPSSSGSASGTNNSGSGSGSGPTATPNGGEMIVEEGGSPPPGLIRHRHQRHRRRQLLGKRRPPPPSPPPPPPSPPPPSPPQGGGNGTASYVVDWLTGMAPGARLAFYDITDREVWLLG